MQHPAHGIFSISLPYLLLVPEVDKRLSEKGGVSDKALTRQIKQFLNEFLWLANHNYSASDVLV
jgi:hypothetical protein